MAYFGDNTIQSTKDESLGKVKIIVETDSCIRAIAPSELAVCAAAKKQIG